MSWLLDLSQPESEKGATGGLYDLESNTRNITLGVTRSTETSNEDFVVLVDESHTTISWDVGSNLLVVLLELHSDALSDSGVRLLGLDGNLIDNNTRSMRRALEWLLPLGTLISFFVIFISPPIKTNYVRIIYVMRRLLTD
tara:strand:- start:155 stop:577 length:423 start_codon:yes stop_codon:yes gene_type:complete